MNLGWLGVSNEHDGYGRSNALAIRAVRALGVQVSFQVVGDIDPEMHPEVHAAVVNGPVRRGGRRRAAPVLPLDRFIYFPPQAYQYWRGQHTVGMTMFESTRLPDGWVDGINENLDRLVLPSQWCREVFIDNGVNVPVDVVPLAVDFEKWPVLEREEHDTFTVVCYNVGGTRRKGYDVLVRAFKKAFPRRRDVRLIVKCACAQEWETDDPRIESIVAFWPQEDILSLLADADLAVYPSRGEGFGLGVIESMATGLPCVLTNGTALRDLCDERYNLPFPIKGYSPCELDGHLENDGQWVEPDDDALADVLRWAYNHRSVIQQRGLLGAQWVRRRFDMETLGRKLVKTFNKAGIF